TYQYVWRDWVVKAMNANLPFDQFTIQQLAGDLLPNATLDQKVATGFNRCHLLNGEGGAIPEEQRNVILFDRVDVTATTWLATTISTTPSRSGTTTPSWPSSTTSPKRARPREAASTGSPTLRSRSRPRKTPRRSSRSRPRSRTRRQRSSVSPVAPISNPRGRR